MEATDHRPVVSQLAEDLTWLEEHSRRQPELARQVGQLRLAAGLVRNVIGPFLNDQAPVPLHLAVVGGAGAGKSTIVNFLCGTQAAEANPQAGYTRHPTAYISSHSQFAWPAHAGYLGTLQRLSQPSPANLDEDVFQVRRVAGPSTAPNSREVGFGPLGDCIVWDCPDMTTWAATGYVPRLLEVASLADVVIYVASDERYNDEVPTQFLNLLIRAGKPVIVCLTKMREAVAGELVAHFQTEVLGRLPKTDRGRSTIPVLAIPYLTSDQLADPVKQAGQYRIPLLNQVLALAEPADATRRRSVEAALRFLNNAGEGLLDVARQDLGALDSWRSLVASGQEEFSSRYRREFLNGERFRRFDDTREQLMEMLELPGAGRLVSVVFNVLRAPYRLIRGFMAKSLSGAEGVNLPEEQVLDSSMRAWLDLLRAESLKRADTHPLWRHVVNGFNSGLADSVNDRFHQQLRHFQLSSADEIDNLCRGMTSGLEQQTSLLASLRVGKILLDLTAIGLGFWVGGLTWGSLITIPVFVSIVHQVVELIVWQYVEQRRAKVRSHKEATVKKSLAVSIGEYLTAWPATGGSTYERLQTTLQRVPDMIRTVSTQAELRVKEQTALAERATP